MTSTTVPPESVRRDTAIKDALIGVHPLGMRRPPAMTELWGNKATSQLSADLRKLGSGDPLRRKKGYQTKTAEYRRIVEAALDLHPQAILSNSYDGGYSDTDRKDGFYTGDSVYSMSHRVFVPYLPGGFLKVSFILEGPLDRLGTQLAVDLECFRGDWAGAEADHPEHNERNRVCIVAVADYIVEVSNQ